MDREVTQINTHIRQNSGRRTALLVWLIVATAAVALQIPTLRISPTIWQDEAEITEWGRVTLFEPHSSWSATWDPVHSTPMYRMTYLGMAMQEAAYRITGSFLGPRVNSLVGAVVCATLMIALLRSYGLAWAFALAGAAAFFLDPVVVSSYRNGRVDLWAMGASISAAILVRMGPDDAPSRLRYGAAGLLAMLSLWLYPSAILLIPFIALAMISRPGVASARPGRPPLLWCGAAAAVTFVLLRLPVLSLVPRFAGELFTVYRGQLAANPLSYKLLSVQLSPVLMGLFLFASFRKMKDPLVLTTWAVILFIWLTNAYSYRFLYLYPPFFVIVATYMATWKRKDAYLVLAFLLVWSAGMSLGWRSYCAVATNSARDPEIVTRAAKSLLGSGQFSVYAPYEFYYAGRSLGWHILIPWGGGPERTESVLRRVQYVIAAERYVDDARLRGLNFELVRRFGVPPDPSEGVWWRRLRLGGPPYSSYCLYRKR